jgi:photosystem II stability/assembly factor-like uncharacterized protein
MKKTFSCLLFALTVSWQPAYSQWVVQPSPVTSRLYDIKFSGGRGVMIGDNVILVSGDTGSTWTVQNFPKTWMFEQSTVQTKDSIWVAGWMTNNRQNILLKTSNGGSTWDVVDTSVNSISGTSVYFLDKTHGWVGGSGSGIGADTNGWISRTTNGGRTWQKTDSSLDLINDVFFGDSLHGWTCSEGGKIYRSTDGGLTWSFNYLALNGTITEPIRHIQFTTIDSGWASGGMNVQTILRTTDAGQSWRINTTSGDVDNVFGMHFSDSQNGWLVGGWGGTARIAHTSDGGNTWSLQADPVPVSSSTFWFYGVYMFNSKKGIVVGGGGTILKTTDGGLVDAIQEETMSPVDFQLMQNFPNPFNPSTTLRYALPARGHVRLQVYNILGEVVADLVDAEQAAGWNQVVWNANVASGLYFYRLEAVSVSDANKRFVDVKKMILLK